MADWTQTIATIASIVAVGVALLAYITRQFNRIGDQLRQLDSRLQNVEVEQARFGERFNRVDERFNRMDDRFDRVEARIDRLEERLGSMEQWQARADERFDRVEARLDRVEERLDEGLQDVRGDLQNLGMEQARMLGFLEGRGVMGKAPAEAEPAT